MKGSRWILIGAVFCGLAVALGAWAAHGLDRVLLEKYGDATKDFAGQTIPAAVKYLHDFKTGVEYQMYHGLALIAVGLIAERNSSRLVGFAGWSFAFGILFFSGSLYILALTGVTKWGAVTPIGGLSFLIGWFLLAVSTLRSPR